MDVGALRKLNRFREILSVLVKNGFEDIAHRLKFPGRDFIGKVRPEDSGINGCHRLRKTFEELGPIFVKLGQLLSLRPDLFPQEFITEFRKLQDQVVPVPFEEIKQVVESELGKTIESLFSRFDQEPVAAGSLAQVYAATLHDGEMVAVKVRRPAIEKCLKTDLHILETIAPFLEDHLDLARAYNLSQVVKELKRGLKKEIDFRCEAHHMRVATRNSGEDSFVHIPALHDQLCTEGILTMELIRGEKLSACENITLNNRKKIAQQGLRIILAQILGDGFFHADPHPGNFLYMHPNRICLLDWGVVGLLTKKNRNNLAEFVEAAAFQDSERVVNLLLAIIDHQPENLNKRLLHRDILELITNYHNTPLGQVDTRQLFKDINHILCSHQLQIPSDLTMMFKAIIAAEGTARGLDPELNIAEQVQPFIHKILVERYQPKELWRKLQNILSQLSILHRDLPLRVHQLIENLGKGEISIQLQHENLHEFQNTLQHTANQLSFSIIISALIIGSSMIITTGVKPLLFGYPAIGIVGYLISAVLGIGLLFNIVDRR